MPPKALSRHRLESTYWLDRLRFFLIPPRPATGSIYFDCFMLVFVSFFERHIASIFLGDWLFIDIMTPWVTASIVLLAFEPALVIALLAALLQEANSSAPFGMWFLTYLCALAVLHFTKGALSWGHAAPWIVTFFLVQVWSAFFISISILINKNSLALDFEFFANVFCSFVVSVGIGMLFAFPHMFRMKNRTSELERANTAAPVDGSYSL